jgi:ABC-2 type transport system permease protein
MLTGLLRFELRYHTRQLLFWVSAVLFTALGFVISQGNFGGTEIHKNSPYVISIIVSILSLFTVFVSTLFCANVVLRDSACSMDALILATPVKRGPYFMVRLYGLLLAVSGILGFAVAGIWLGTLISDPEQLGNCHILYFVQPLLVFGLPNVLFCCSVIFSIALLTRSTRAVYLGGALLFIFYFLGSILGNSPLMASSVMRPAGPGILPNLLDPFGIVSLFGDTRSWNAQQRNSQLFPLAGIFLVNRLVWMAVSLVLLLVSYRFFPFRLSLPAGSRTGVQPDPIVAPTAYKRVPVLPAGFFYNLSAFLSQLRLESLSLFRHIPFLVMLLLWIFLNGVDLKEEALNGLYGIRFYAASGLIAEHLLSIRPALLLLAFYAAELISRERAVNIQGLVFSTPVPNTVLWGAKCAALAVLIVLLITVNIFTGIGFQLLYGYHHVDFPVYISLYYYCGLPLFLYAVLIVFVQTMFAGKYLGMLFSLSAAGVFTFAHTLGIKHYLLRYATLPQLEYSAMNGFGHYTTVVHWYLLYWICIAVILSLLAAGLWQGSSHTTWWQRLRSIGKRWGRRGKLAAVASLLAGTAAGMYIYNHSPGGSRYLKVSQYWRSAYEKKYRSLSGLPQPVITRIKTNTDLYPESGRYRVSGTYRLKNESAQPVARLWLGAVPEVSSVSFTVPAAIPVASDHTFRQYAYDLRQPLQPGAEMDIGFSMEVIRSGFMPFDKEHAVVSNGTYIELEKYLPFLGYSDRYELSDPLKRKKLGLPAQVAGTSADSFYHLVDYETTVSTVAGQWVVTVGTLQKEWLSGNRYYFHYKTEQPVAFMLALSSARYTLRQEEYHGVSFRIYYQQGQDYNVPVMMQAMKDAIDYGNTHFSPYPLKQLVLAEIPQYRGSATAYPGVLFSAERYNFMTDFSDTTRFNNTYATTAHEVAHQWWANILNPHGAPGRRFLTESLAKYTEAMVVEHRFGKQYLQKYLRVDNGIYFAERYRSGEQEQPLNKVIDQGFVYYSKGGLALYAIKEELGEERVAMALKHLVARHAYPHRKAFAADLLGLLHKQADSIQAKRIDDYLEKVIVYDNRIEVLDCKALADGRFGIKLRVRIRKIDQAGPEHKSILPDDRIDIAVFDRPLVKGGLLPLPVYLHKTHFNREETILDIIVGKKPVAIAVDPYSYLLDDNQKDNIAEIR